MVQTQKDKNTFWDICICFLWSLDKKRT